MYFGKEVRIILKWKAKDVYPELKKRDDKEANPLDKLPWPDKLYK